MKGPYERLKYVLRRVWECPDCQHRERSEGNVTSVVCRCQSDKQITEWTYMKLIKDGVRRVTRSVE